MQGDRASASPCSTPPTSTASAAARKLALGQVLGPRRKDIVLASKFGMEMDAAGTKPRAARATTSCEAVERASPEANEAPTGSTSTRSTAPTPLTPIEETLRALEDLDAPGQGALHRLLELRRPGRWSEAQWTAKTSRPRGLRLGAGRIQPAGARAAEKELITGGAGLSASACCPISRWRAACSPASTARNRPLPEGARHDRRRAAAGAALHERGELGQTVERLADFCAARGRTPAGPRLLLAARPAGGGERDRRRHPARADRTANVKAAEWTLSADELAEIDAITR
jgi:hypothetical protein